MDHVHVHQKIQGGRAGLGSYLPHQIQHLKRVPIQYIVQESARAARNNAPIADDLHCSMHET